MTIDASIPMSGKFASLSDILDSQSNRAAHAQQQQLVQRQIQAHDKTIADDAELKQITGGGAQGQDLVDSLMKAGRVKEAGAYQDQLHKQSTQGFEKQKNNIELAKHYATGVLANPTEQTAIGALDQLSRQTGENVDADKAAVYAMRGNPNAIKQWAAGHALSADKLLAKTETKDLGGSVQTQQINPVTGEVSIIGTTPKTMSPGEVQQGQLTQASHDIQRQGQAVTMRGQNMAADTAAAGRAATANSASEKLAAKGLAGESSGQFFETAVSSLERLKTHEGLDKAVGIRSMFPTIPGGHAADFEAQLDTFKAQTFVPMVASLKGMGALSDAEGKKLSDAVGALSLKQGKKDFVDSANRIEKELRTKYEKATGKVMAGHEYNSMPDPSTMNGALGEIDGVKYRSNGKSWVRQ